MTTPGNLIDGTDVTTHAQLVDVSSQTLRNAISKNVYGANYQFRILALTDATPMSSEAVKYYGSSPDEVSTTNSAPLHWKFRGRIIDAQSRPSPHSFCQDPCDLTTAPPEARGLAAQFLELHTQFVVATDSAVGIKENDEVIITLNKGMPYQYDLQHSFCDNPSVRAYSPDNISNTVACQNMASLDWTKTATLPNSVATPLPGDGIAWKSGIVIFQHHIDFAKVLRTEIDKLDTTMPTITFTSAYRTDSAQAQAMATMIRDSANRSLIEYINICLRRRVTPSTLSIKEEIQQEWLNLSNKIAG